MRDEPTELLYVRLPALEPVEYLQPGGALAVALSAAMLVPSDRHPEFKAEELRYVSESNENEYRKFLLTEFDQAHLPLERAEEQGGIRESTADRRAH